MGLEGCVDSIGSRNGRQPGFYKVEEGKCDREDDNILSPGDCKNAVDLQMPASNNRTFQGNRKKRPFGCWAEKCRSPDGYDCSYGIGDEESPDVPPGEFVTLC